MYPLFVGNEFVNRLVKLPEPSEILRNGNAANVFHQKSILAVERLGIHRYPRLAVAHRLQDANHIPSVDVIADRHHPVGKELAVLADFFTPLNPEAKPDAVQRKGHKPGGEIDEQMPYLEFQRFVKVVVGAVKLYVLAFSAYGPSSNSQFE